MRRAVAGGVAAIGLAFVASIALVERLTRPEGGEGRRPGAEVVARGPPLDAIRAPSFAGAPAEASPPRPGPPRAAGETQPGPPQGAAEVPASGDVRLQFAFRLDPRLTRSLHMGDRWVSPPKYSRTGDSSLLTIRARARVVGDGPPRAPAGALWMASEPDMIAFTPDRGDEVEVVVLRAGESWITVNTGEVRGALRVKASPAGGRLRVDIAQ